MNITKSEFDYTKPLFIFYIGIMGLSRQRADTVLDETVENMKYTNLQYLIVPIDGTSRVECIWQGYRVNDYNDMMVSLALEIDKIYKSTDNVDIQNRLRQLIVNCKIDNLINPSEQAS